MAEVGNSEAGPNAAEIANEVGQLQARARQWGVTIPDDMAEKAGGIIARREASAVPNAIRGGGEIKPGSGRKKYI